MKEQRKALEDQISQIKKDLANLTKINKEALEQQRTSFEERIREMEDEITKVSLNRYKNELDSKQRYLKTSQKYEVQIRDLRASLALVLHFLEIDSLDIPEFLKSSSSITPRDLRNILQDNHELHELIAITEKKIV
jgi:septal ring factor EnvC (AmiA/AmiB activator)